MADEFAQYKVKPTAASPNLAAQDDFAQHKVSAKKPWVNNLPTPLDFGFKAASGVLNPSGQSIKNNLKGAWRGIQDIGEGAKQLGLLGKQALGFGNPNDYIDYTKAKEAERAAYNQSEAGQNPYSNLVRSGVKQIPAYAAGSAGLLMKAPMLARMMMGGSAGGLEGAAQYTSPTESRPMNMGKGALQGAVMGMFGNNGGKATYPPPGDWLAEHAAPAGLKGQVANATAEHGLAEQRYKEAKDQAYQGSGISSPEQGQKLLAEKQAKLQDLYTQLSEKPPVNAQEEEVAHRNLSQAMAEYKQAQAAAKQATGVRTPEDLGYKINQGNQKLQELNDALAQGKPVQPEELQAAREQAKQAAQAYDEAKNAAEQSPIAGTSKPNALQLKINKNQEKLDELEASKPVPLDEHADLSAHENNVKRAEDSQAQANNVLQDVDRNIGRHLNVEEHHEMAGSREMKHEIDSIEEYWPSEYKDLMEKLKKSNFQLMHPDRVDRIQGIIDRFESFDDPTGDLSHILKQSPKFSDKSASSFMAKFKDFRDARYDLLQRLKTEPNNERRQQMYRVYHETQPLQNVINETLADGLGEFRPKYEYINKGYTEQYFPLKENSVARKIKNGEKLSSNIASELAGDQEGQALLREIAKRNPEMLRTIVGQQYKNPESLGALNNEMMREYTNEMPELNRLIAQRNEAIQASNEAKGQANQARVAHEEAKNVKANFDQAKASYAKDKAKIQGSIDLLKKFKEAVEKTSEGKATAESASKELEAQDKLNTSVNKEIAKIQKGLPVLEEHRANLQKFGGKITTPVVSPKEAIKAREERASLEREVQRTQDEIALIEKDKANLMQQRNRKDITLQEKNDLENKLDAIVKKRQTLIRRSIKAATGLGTIGGLGGLGYAAVYGIKSALSELGKEE